jgi:hemerythrin superfamily protein
MSTDAIVILKNDHKNVKKLFRDFQRASGGSQRKRISDKVVEELTVHTYLENEVMYPKVRALMPKLEDDILESYEEHHVADVLCLELSEMDADDERLAPKFTVLAESVSHHIEEEEDNWFPKVRKELSRTQLAEIGEEMERMRPRAPKDPHDPKAKEKARHAVEA